MNIPSACACLGPQFNEPPCPCAMRRLGLPPSPERLADIEYRDTNDYKKEQEEQWDKLKRAFEASRELKMEHRREPKEDL